jgi:hypothetical protein
MSFRNNSADFIVTTGLRNAVRKTAVSKLYNRILVVSNGVKS